MSRSVGVALANNSVRVFFERGSPLPMRRSFALRTVEALSPADPDAQLRVPIVQGEFPFSHLCRLVGAIEIPASSLSAPLPVDSLVEVSIELDRGGRLAARACVPDTGAVFEHVAQLVTASVVSSELLPRLEALRLRLQDTRARAFKHGAQRAVVVLGSADAIDAECARSAASARGGDQDAGEKAQRLLLELDALIAEAENELAWPDLDARARRGLANAVAWVGELGTPIERQVLADATVAMQKASAARNARELRQHLSTISHLGFTASMRSEGAWESELDDLAGTVAASKDPKQAARLLAEGRKAVERRDKAGLESAVRALWQLKPDSGRERERGHWSGVT